MSITFSGLATGLDTDSIVTGLMEVERAPLERLETKQADAQERLEAFAQFDAKLDSLLSAVGDMNLTSEVQTTAISLSSEDSFSATSSSAAEGSYNISVAQLSQVQKNITDGFSSKTESIFGSGTIDINGTTINITDETNSVVELAEAINSVSETTGVSVSIINSGTDTPFHMVFTGKDANTSFTLSSDLTGASGDPAYNFNETEAVQTAQQAVAFIDGIRVVSDNNTISDAISGVTISLNNVSEITSSGVAEENTDPWDWAVPPVYATDQMTVEADTDALKEKITTFVTAYNDVMDWILSGYDEFGSSTSTTEVTGDDDAEEATQLGSVLRGDSTINSVKRQLQSVLSDAIDNTGQLAILSQIGITTNLNGTLSQDNTKLDEALNGDFRGDAELEGNFTDIVKLLAGDDDTGGVMKNFNSLLLDLTSGSTGMYASQKNSYDTSMDRYDYQIELMEIRLEKREDTLRSQFSAMETLVSSLNSQGDYITQAFEALSGS